MKVLKGAGVGAVVAAAVEGARKLDADTLGFLVVGSTDKTDLRPLVAAGLGSYGGCWLIEGSRPSIVKALIYAAGPYLAADWSKAQTFGASLADVAGFDARAIIAGAGAGAGLSFMFGSKSAPIPVAAAK